MRKTIDKVQRMPRRLKLLSALLACVLVCTLVGVGLAAASETSIDENHSMKICGNQIEVSTKAIDAKDASSSSTDWGVWTYGGDKITGVMTGYQENQRSPARQTELTLTNVSEEPVIFSFEWTSNYSGHQNSSGSVTVGTDTATNKIGESPVVGKFEATLRPGDSAQVIVGVAELDQEVREDDLPTETITLSEFNVSSAENKTITLKPPVNGSYTVTYGSTSKTMSAGSGEETFTYKTTDGITVTATADDDYKFALLRDGDDPLTTKSGETVYPSGDTLSVLFVSKTEKAPFHIGDSDYYYWEDTMRAAMRQTVKTVVMDTDNNGRTYSLPTNVENHGVVGMKYAKNESGAAVYTIPNGVTLVVPYSEKHSTAIDDAVNTTAKSGSDANPLGITNADTGTAYATLTVPQGVTLNINGTLNVNALHGAANGNAYMSHVVGDYGKMVVGGTVNVNAGGKLYARGYIVDKNHTSGGHIGNIHVLSGGTLIQLMQITDWRGGNCTFAVYQKVMPITMYYLQNDMVKTTYDFGAAMRAQVMVAASDEVTQASVPVVSNNSNTSTDGDRSMFVMKGENAQIVTDYDYNSDKLLVTVESGTVTMNYLQISVGSLAVDTRNNVLAVSDNLKVTVGSGATMAINYSLKFLPGAELVVDKGGNLQVGKNAKLYFYRADDYDAGWSYGTYRKSMPVSGIVNEGIDNQTKSDAIIKIGGTLTVDGVILQSGGSAADSVVGIETLQSTDAGAKIVLNRTPRNYGTLNECYMNGLEQKTDGKAYLKTIFAGHDLRANDNYYTANSGWIAPVGYLANGDTTAQDKFKTSGTYRVAEVGEQLSWYQNSLTYKFVDADGKEIPGSRTQYSAYGYDTVQAPEKYVITGVEFDKSLGDNTKAITVYDANGNNELANGWRAAKLINLVGDGTVTFTCKSYTHAVRWEETYASNESDTPNSVWIDYTDVATASRTFDTEITTEDVTVDPVGATVSVNGKTVTVSDFNFDITVKVRSNPNKQGVAWNITYPDGSVETKTETPKDGTAKLNIPKPNDGWYIVEDETDCAATDQKVTLTVDNAGNTITAENVTGSVTVNVKLTKRDHKLTFEETTVDKTYGKTDKGTTETTVEYIDGDIWAYEPSWFVDGKEDDKVHAIIRSYSITGGTLDGETKDDNCTLQSAIFTLADEAVTIQLTRQAYMIHMTWKLICRDDAELGFTREEYVLEGSLEDGTYRSVMSDGTDDKVCAGAASNAIVLRQELPADAKEKRYAFDKKYTTCILTPDGNPYDGKYNSAVNFDAYSAATYKVLPKNGAFPDELNATIQMSKFDYKIAYVDANNEKVGESYGFVGENNKPLSFDNVYGSTPTYHEPQFPIPNTGTVESDGVTRYWALFGYAVLEGDAKINNDSRVKVENLEPVQGENLKGKSAYKITSCTKDSVIQLDFEKFGLASYSARSCFSIWKITQDNEEKTYYEFYNKVSEGEYTAFSNLGNPDSKYEVKQSNEEGATTYTAPEGYYIFDWSGDKEGQISTDRRSLTSPKARNKTHKIPLKSLEETKEFSVYINGVQKIGRCTPDGTWEWTTDGDIITDVTVTGGGAATIATGKKTVTLTGVTTETVVRITTEKSVNLGTYFMGDMSFEYVRNAAAFTWNGEAGTKGTWKPVDSFAWRHAAGSRSYSGYFTDGNTYAYTVPNGSVLLVNNTGYGSGFKYEIEFQRDSECPDGVGLKIEVDPSNTSAIKGTVTKDGDKYIITLNAKSRALINCSLTGNPGSVGKDAVSIGKIVVTPLTK